MQLSTRLESASGVRGGAAIPLNICWGTRLERGGAEATPNALKLGTPDSYLERPKCSKIKTLPPAIIITPYTEITVRNGLYIGPTH